LSFIRKSVEVKLRSKQSLDDHHEGEVGGTKHREIREPTLKNKTKPVRTRMMIPAATAVLTILLVAYEYGVIVVLPGGADVAVVVLSGSTAVVSDTIVDDIA